MVPHGNGSHHAHPVGHQYGYSVYGYKYSLEDTLVDVVEGTGDDSYSHEKDQHQEAHRNGNRNCDLVKVDLDYRRADTSCYQVVNRHLYNRPEEETEDAEEIWSDHVDAMQHLEIDTFVREEDSDQSGCRSVRRNDWNGRAAEDGRYQR